ncbi:MAG TPA: glycolate oxidase subunit GlcE [Casimicrobiaceae bacterium]|jgi:glycolate oxidase FAD binding subunit|nr:glycolate oxidase subunit GlcE [Casimicrobiaceae bacterium]
MTDRAIATIEERIRAAASDRRPLCIRGGGTKAFYGEVPTGELLDVRDVRGIVSYAPAELVVTARGGTPLVEIEDALAEHGQLLAFEPPRFAAGSTLGGVVASGLSGPRRPYAGSVRDFVLGTRVIDGTGASIAFGGQVIKNVAGFDVSRLMTGALGTLGVLTEISLKCLPKPKVEATRALACDVPTALRLMNEWGGKPLPISATAHHDGMLRVRLSGTAAGVANAETTIGGEAIDGDGYWTALRDHTHDYFRPAIDGGAQLWRLSVRSTAPICDVPGDAMIEWGGALRWLVCSPTTDAVRIREWASGNGGHATLFRAADKAPGVFQPLAPPLAQLHARLAHVFDPHGILNPGRMYPR